MPASARQAVRQYQTTHPDKFARLDGESWGQQVRLESVDFNHETHEYRILLSPTKYLYYVAIQARLWSPLLRELRSEGFENSVDWLTDGGVPILPNQFALHMAIASADNKLLVRQRSDDTELYPGVWEASIGEFMHGPDHQNFPHFTSGEPDLGLFCCNAVAEETNYFKASPGEFTACGFAVEYRTLAPKLFILWRSRANMSTLLSQGVPSDAGRRLDSVDLTPSSLADALSAHGGRIWTPSSKLISLIALTNAFDGAEQKALVQAEFQRNYAGEAQQSPRPYR